jgi:hypothetical protein
LRPKTPGTKVEGGLGKGFQGRIVPCRRASVRPWFVRRLEDVKPSRGTSAPHPGGVRFYGVVSAQTEKVVEFFLEREAGEAMIARFG